jgi:succinate dehydrogenase hydrophobic anchor subunit
VSRHDGVTEEIYAPECFQRLVHFPSAHSEECCRLLARILAACGLTLFVMWCGSFAPSSRIPDGIVIGLLALIIYTLRHLISMVKKLLGSCNCGRRIGTFAEAWKAVFWMGLVCCQSIFCRWLGALHVLPDYWVRNSTGFVFEMLSCALPAFTLFCLARCIRAHDERLIARNQCLIGQDECLIAQD